MMRWVRLGGILLVLAVLLNMAACGRSEKATGYQTADDYQVTFATAPAAAVVGEGQITVTLLDKAGQPVTGARVALEANMNHAGMVPVYADMTDAGGGVYRTPLVWTMGGAWYVDAKITLRNGEVLRRRFPLDVK